MLILDEKAQPDSYIRLHFRFLRISKDFNSLASGWFWRFS